MDAMKPTGKRAVALRTTPRRFRGQDAELFPDLHARARCTHAPTCYEVYVYRHVVRLIFDMYYVTEEVGSRLAALYRQYVDWWFTVHRKHRPREGVQCTGCFSDFVAVTVLREHARLWIALFDATAPFIEHPLTRGFAEYDIESLTSEIQSIARQGKEGGDVGSSVKSVKSVKSPAPGGKGM